MIGFCVLCIPPKQKTNRLASKRVVIDLYASYHEISKIFTNTNFSSIQSYSQFISNKYSLNQLSDSINFNNINIYGRMVNESGNNFLSLIYFKDNNYLYKLKKLSNLQLYDEAISTFINIFVYKNRNKNNNIPISINVLKNLQNTINLLSSMNAENSSSSTSLVYWDNRCRNYTQIVTNNTLNKKPIITDTFKKQDIIYYNHNDRRHGDFFTHSKYKRKQQQQQQQHQQQPPKQPQIQSNRSQSFYALTGSRKSIINGVEYKWSRKSTTDIAKKEKQQQPIPQENKKEEEDLDPLDLNQIQKIKQEMSDLSQLIKELRLNKRDDDDDDDDDEEEEDKQDDEDSKDEYMHSPIQQSTTDNSSIDFISDSTVTINENENENENEYDEKDLILSEDEEKMKRSHHRRSRPKKITTTLPQNLNSNYHESMSDTLINYQLKYRKADQIKKSLINNLKLLLNKVENDMLPSFDDDDDDEDDENDVDSDNELNLSCSTFISISSRSSSLSSFNDNKNKIIIDGIGLMKKIFNNSNDKNKHKNKQLFDKIHYKLIQNLSDKNNKHKNNDYDDDELSKDDIMKSIKYRRLNRYNNNNNNKSKKKNIEDVMNNCDDELKQQLNDMMGTIGDDNVFKQKFKKILIEVANTNDNDLINQNDDNDRDLYRKRNSLKFFKTQKNFVQDIIKIEKMPEIQSKYWNNLDWSFDPISFSKDPLINGNCLVILTWHLIKNYLDKFGISSAKIINFLYQIQESYNQSNPYHNKEHATDVVNNVYWFLKNCDLIKKITDDFDKFIILMGAAIHDVDHNGKNNQFHKATNSYLAIRYNDQSILENHHISYSFKLMASDKLKYDWINDLNDNKLIERTRKCFIRWILGTDMGLHKKHLNHMNILNEKIKNNDDDDKKEIELEEEDKINLLGVILHAADIGNATKPNSICIEWAKRCINEFRLQGDDEKKLFGKENQLLFCRDHPLEKSQPGWINFVMKPYFKLLNEIVNHQCKPLLDNLENNLNEWSKYKEY